MKKHLLTLLFLILPIITIAQERLFTDKETGGSLGGIVGKIDDDLAVTPLGQLGYEIPIPVPVGTGGMKPALSICYSSGTKDGLLGYGFDLKGLSVITRIPSDRYHDHQPSAVDFSWHDAFALDGMRLMKCGDDVDYYEYRTENDIFSKIIAYGTLTNPSSFKVYTKSGLIYEYQSNLALLNVPSNKTLFWTVTKVTDTVGNYFTIKYTGNADTNELWATRIDYTGNEKTGLSPYASIRLSYTSNSLPPTTYIYGQKVRRSKIITDIDVYFGENKVRNFKATYSSKNGKNLLTSITESTANGMHKNPTIFNWETVEQFKISNQNYDKTASIHKAKLITGDFNGDGKTDFLAIPENKDAGWTGRKFFVSHGTYFTKAFEGQWKNDGEVKQVVCGDFNGDGTTDIAIKRYCNNIAYNCDLYLSFRKSDGSFYLQLKDIISLPKDYELQPIDVNGGGAMDLFLWNKGKKDYRVLASYPNSNGTIKPLGGTSTGQCEEQFYRVEFADINGDGLIDVLNLTDTGTLVLQSNGFGSFIKKDKILWPTQKHGITFGDFNGDGKSDMLLTSWQDDPNENGWSQWCILFSKGDGTFEKTYVPKMEDARKKQKFVADFNGDGYDDIQLIDLESSGSNMTKPMVFLGNGRGGFNRQDAGANVYALDKWHFYTGDFNGDGKEDFICTSDWNKSNWDGYQLFLMPNGHNNLLNKIVDGLGNETNIEYKYLSDNDVFERGNSSKYPVASVGLSYPVVSTIKTPNGIGGIKKNSYKYSNALFHIDGRGFLGFETFTANDESTSTSSITKYEFDSLTYAGGIKEQKTYVNNHIVAEATYINTIKYGKKAVNHYTYLPTKIVKKNYEYNSSSVLKDITTTITYDDYGNPTSINTRDGNVTTQTFNQYENDEELWRLGRLTMAHTYHSNHNSGSSETAYFKYDQNTSFLQEEHALASNKALGYTKTYERDSFGNIIKSTISPDDGTVPRTTQTQYDSKGRLMTASTSSLDFVTRYTQDEIFGNILSSTDENGIVTNNSYDAFGRLLQSNNPIEKEVYTIGWSEGMTDAPSHALYFTYEKATGKPYKLNFYDCLGRVIRTITESLDAQRIFQDTEYDNKGQVTRTSEPYFYGSTIYWNKNEYDFVGRTTTQTAPNGASYIYQYSGLYTFTFNPNHTRTSRKLDTNGNLAESQDAQGGSIKYEYDYRGNCVYTTGLAKLQASYDAAGNRTRLSDPVLGVSTYKYNAYGELISHTDGHGTTSYQYDDGGRLIKETRPDMTIIYEYDRGWKGALDKKQVQGGPSINYKYDSYGRVVSEQTVVNGNSFTIQTSYNALSLPDVITYPNGLKIQNIYSSCGIQTAVQNYRTGKVYWKLKKLNARGQIESEELGNGLTTTTTYDEKVGTLSSISTPGIQNWSYTFNAIGNLTSRHNLSKNLHETFEYDYCHRLTRVYKNGSEAQRITYNADGRIASKSDVGSYVYDDAGRLSEIKDRKYELRDWNKITYNSLSKISYAQNGNAEMTITYGPDGNRIMSTLAGESKYYIGNLFEHYQKNGNRQDINYIFVQDKAIAMVKQTSTDETTTNYLHHDHLGSIQAYSDEKGKLSQELSYDAWGCRRNPSTWLPYATIQNADALYDRGFGGHEHIDQFEMINMNGRMYDPVAGMFLSPDPFVQAPDNPQGFYRYSYCMNNPLSLTDPSGYSWFSKNWKSLTAAVVGIGVTVLTAGTGASFGVAVAAGAAGGAASALTVSLLNGSNFGQIAKNTMVGGFWGAVSGCLNNISADEDLVASLFKHTFTEGGLDALQGGNAVHGFMMGLTSSAGGYFIDNNLGSLGKAGEITANSMLSGLVDEIGGGKFANGAITGAFSLILNDWAHHHFSDKVLKKIYDEYIQISYENERWVGIGKLCSEIGGEIGAIASEIQNGCAIRLSYALNKSGMYIPHLRGTLKGSDGYNYFLNASEMAKYLSKYRLGTISKGKYARNCLIFQYPNKQWSDQGVSGHVDIVYRSKWGSGSGNITPYKDLRTEIFH